MKRVVVSLLMGLILTGWAAAQSAGLRSFRQIGAATAELNSDQLVASHPSLSMGTRLKVTNTANGKEAVVTVTGRIPASGTRIIDLSRAALTQLEMNPSGTTPVTIEVLRNTELAAAPPPDPEPEPVREEPVAVAKEEPEPVREEPKPVVREEPKPVQEEKPKKQQESVTIYNTITVTAKTPVESAPAAPVPAAAPAPVQTIPVIAAPVFKAVPVYCPPQVPPAQVPPAQVLVASVPVKTVAVPVQPQVQLQCPPAQASVVYSVPPQVVYSVAPAPQAYRQVQAQPAYECPPQKQVQPAYAYTQPQASYQQPVQAPQQPSYRQAPQPQVAVYTSPGSPLQPPVAVYTAPAPAPQAPAVAYSVQPSALIKPHLPDPAGSGVYRVQVGSYADPQNAQVVAECLVRAGLCPAYEQYGQVWRVVIPGVSAQQLTFVAQQLGALGINEAWIRQEG